MAQFRPAFALCSWNLRSISGRLRGAAVVVAGFFGVIVIFAAVLSIREGVMRATSLPQSDRIAVTFAHVGTLGSGALDAIRAAPGVARDRGGALVTPTLVTSIVMEDWKPGLFATAVLRGIAPNFGAVMPGFRITRGRMFKAGVDEAIIGRGAERLYPGLDVGHELRWNHHVWKIVGAYTYGEGNADSEFAADLRQLQAANNAGDVYTDIDARLVSPAAFPAFKRAIEHHPGFAVTVETLAQRSLDFSGTLNGLLLLADGVITLLMAVGAVFGTLNVMYANVASRSAELATLKALGFGRFSILCAVLSESLLLALVGGGLGVLVAFIVFNGLEASTEAGSLIDFRFAVTARAAATALVLALAMGFVGGLFPALRAARLPLARALRNA